MNSEFRIQVVFCLMNSHLAGNSRESGWFIVEVSLLQLYRRQECCDLFTLKKKRIVVNQERKVSEGSETYFLPSRTLISVFEGSETHFLPSETLKKFPIVTNS